MPSYKEYTVDEKPKFRIAQRVILAQVHPAHDIAKVQAQGYVGVIKRVWRSPSRWMYHVGFYASPSLNRHFDFAEKYLAAFSGQTLKLRDRHYFGEPNRQGNGWDFIPETTDQIADFDQALIEGSVWK